MRSSFRMMENSPLLLSADEGGYGGPEGIGDLDEGPEGRRDHPVLDLGEERGGEPRPLRELLDRQSLLLPEGPDVLPHRDLALVPRFLPVSRFPGDLREDIVQRFVTRDFRQGRLLPSVR